MDHTVTVVILNWNGKKWLETFLPYLIKTTYHAHKVLLVDNGSEDDSLTYVKDNFPQIEILALGQNYGFADGNNRAIPHIDTSYVALLNSDVEVTPGWLEPLVDALSKSANVAAVQPKICAYHQKTSFEYAGAAGGFLDWLGYPFCRGRVFDTLEPDKGQYDKPIEVFWATGACCLIRKTVIDEIGLFDPDFFAHMEEIDFCWRAQNFGYTIACRPDSIVYHVGGGTLPQGNPRKTYLNVRNNLAMLYKNLPQDKVLTYMGLRMLLDYVWGVKALLGGDLPTLGAIFRGHRDFFQYKTQWKQRRKTLYQQRNIALPKIGYYPKSIVWQYFVRGRKKWSELMSS